MAQGARKGRPIATHVAVVFSLKAKIEVDAALGIIQEAAQFPEQMTTTQLESKDPKVRSVVLRKP